ncbi:MAG TPA: methyltransferase domain-containing protein [Kofleriaceae bacterium]|nr:methyltransferase domain-containing protein [Kofleriaceae bacterium]
MRLEQSLSRARVLGTRAGLEDLVIPSSRDQALRELVAAAAIQRGERVAEIGSRGGRLLHHLRPFLPGRGARYTGVDGSRSGMRSARYTAWALALADYTEFVESESRTTVPLPSGSHDVVFVHFHLHRLAVHERRALLADAGRVLGPGGRLMVAEPTAGYDAALVVGASVERDADLRHLGPLRTRWNRVAGHRLLRLLEGARAAEVARGQLHAYDEAGLRGELDGAGFAVDRIGLVPESGAITARAHVER